MSYTNGKSARQRTTHTKFQTAYGMASIRHDQEVLNSMRKRGLIENSDKIVRELFTICGCGAEGCGFTSFVRQGDDAVERMKSGKDPQRG